MRINQKFSFCLLIIMLGKQILTQYSEEIMLEAQTCFANKDLNTCSSVKLTSGIYQCCKASITAYLSTSSTSSTITSCSIQMPPIKLYKEEVERESTKAYYKEAWGYVVNNVVTGAAGGKVEKTYNCKDGTATMRFGFDTYTEEEIEILQSDEHCLAYFYGLNEFTTKEDCFNSVILPSSKKVGLSCGYFEFDIKFSDGTSKNLKSCNIFNKDIITNKPFR